MHHAWRMAASGCRAARWPDREIAVDLVDRWMEACESLTPSERQQYIDASGYLPDDILTKVDRASMAVSLEVRVPVLDHRIVEFALRLPPAMKTDAAETKRVLRRVLARHVPPSSFERPKQGFGGPVRAWLRGPLREWAQDLLSRSTTLRHGAIDPDLPSTGRRRLDGAGSRRITFCRVALAAWFEANL